MKGWEGGEGKGGTRHNNSTTQQRQNNEHRTQKQNHRVHQEHTNFTMGTVKSQNRARGCEAGRGQATSRVIGNQKGGKAGKGEDLCFKGKKS